MRRLPTKFDGIVHLAPDVHGDSRGFFLEAFREDVWAENGVDVAFVQDNHSRSGQGVVRGMHFSLGDGQAKLIRCGRGSIWDVVVDLRGGSPTYGEWEAVVLDDAEGHQLFVPVGFAHGFCVLSDVADVMYKVSSYYDPAVERGFRWDDPAVGIAWPPEVEHHVSERDATAPLLADIAGDLTFPV
ncbi:dTDP-4-dehydrorhamnose 3,5-epimerase [Baekduia alba]|uniref:dTDP-4-dehydrorhamnose 3,5-epimerase n=1 Tax=Baekduia alba TaxID=2997333 RepID=UPI00234069C3|nr:dTDP-4-dehydrorhamnose 3,5-epimerase [Baekduia alba]WCB96562.1 dTDP-4-dehydrorhamnose 3,5-epimerase [Baekduia alba]